MNKIFAIAAKELKAYFKSPIAYIVLIITISIFNLFFFMVIDENRESTLRDIFKVMEFLFVFIVPLLTMRIFAEEKSTGTMEFLMTTPTSNTVIVFGKYLGSLLFFSLIIGFSFSYYLIIEYFGHPDRAATFLGYLGLWLEGAMFIAIGLMTSSWSRNQIVSAMCTYVILIFLYFAIGFIKYVSTTLEPLIQYVGVLTHSENLTNGVLATSDIIYFVSIILFSLFITRISIENRLWR